MRILLTADWHCCPLPLSGLDRAQEWRDVAGALVVRARDVHPDVIVVAGDLFDRPRPTPAEIRDVIETLTLLGRIAPVVCIPGTPSHDGNGPDRLGPTGILSAVDLAGVGVACGPLVTSVGCPPAAFVVACLPGASKSWLANAEEGRGASPVALHQAMSARLADVIRGLAAEAAQHSLPAILVGHLSVDGCVASSDESIRMTSEPVLARDSFPDVFQAVCLGHLHKPQVIQEKGPWIGYPGSFLRANWGEERDGRGFWVLDLEPGCPPQTEFHTLPATNLVTVEVDARQAEQPTVAIWDTVDCHRAADGGIIRVRARLTEQQARAIDWPAIEAHARELGAVHWCPPIVEVERVTRTRGDGISTAMGPLQALGAYIEATPALAQDRDSLLARARTQEGVGGDG